MAEPKPKPLSAADVAAMFKNNKVRVPVLKKGEEQRGDDAKIITKERAPTAADIVDFSEVDGVVTAVTVDGQKLTA